MPSATACRQRMYTTKEHARNLLMRRGESLAFMLWRGGVEFDRVLSFQFTQELELHELHEEYQVVRQIQAVRRKQHTSPNCICKDIIATVRLMRCKLAAAVSWPACHLMDAASYRRQPVPASTTIMPRGPSPYPASGIRSQRPSSLCFLASCKPSRQRQRRSRSAFTRNRHGSVDCGEASTTIKVPTQKKICCTQRTVNMGCSAPSTPACLRSFASMGVHFLLPPTASVNSWLLWLSALLCTS